MTNQKTLKHKVSYAIDKAVITFKPANVNSGIIFYNSNIGEYIKIDYAKLTKTNNEIFFNHEILLANYNMIIAALYICGINNILIQIENSSGAQIALQKLIFILSAAGQTTQSPPLKKISITKAESIQSGKTSVKIRPYKGRKVTIISNNTEQEILYEFDSNVHVLQKDFSHINHYSNFSRKDEQMQFKALNMLGDLYASGITNAHLQATKDDTNNYFQLIKSIVSKQTVQKDLLTHVI